MAIHEVDKSDVRAMQRFAALERELLGGFPMYVSNFDSEVVRQLSGKSPATRGMKIAIFIASDEERDVARCAAIINPKFQAAKNEKVGSIGYFAAAPNSEKWVKRMIEQAEGWLKAQSIQRIIAPFNGSPLLGYGFLTTAFDEEPVTFFGWNPPYYPEYFLQAGYQPKYPMYVYTSDFSSEKYRAAKEKAAARHDIQLRPINKKDWEAELELFRELINENFTQEWLWYPLQKDEFLDSFEAMKPMIDPRQMVIAEINGKPAGAVIAYPNWNPLVRSFQGKSGNWQKVQFLLRGGHYETAGTALVAVKAEYRGRWIGPALKMAVFQRYEELGLKKAYGYTIDADNLASRRMNEAVGAVPRLMYHAYDKILTDR